MLDIGPGSWTSQDSCCLSSILAPCHPAPVLVKSLACQHNNPAPPQRQRRNVVLPTAGTAASSSGDSWPYSLSVSLSSAQQQPLSSFQPSKQRRHLIRRRQYPPPW